MRRLGDDILEPVNTGRWIRVSLLLLLVLLVLLVVVVLLLLLFCETSGTHSSTHRSMSASGLPNSGACCGVHVDRKEPRGNERGRERGRNESETGPLGEPLQREREREEAPDRRPNVRKTHRQAALAFLRRASPSTDLHANPKKHRKREERRD